MTEEPYLILHRVRGEPAFDIATKLQIGDEEGWIIPTSGHRAYPYWQQKLTVEAINGETYTVIDGQNTSIFLEHPPIPIDLPDHYPNPTAHMVMALHPPSPSGSLAQRLGLVPKTEPVIISRRI